jgi:hypothetical protein
VIVFYQQLRDPILVSVMSQWRHCWTSYRYDEYPHLPSSYDYKTALLRNITNPSTTTNQHQDTENHTKPQPCNPPGTVTDHLPTNRTRFHHHKADQGSRKSNKATRPKLFIEPGTPLHHTVRCWYHQHGVVCLF